MGRRRQRQLKLGIKCGLSLSYPTLGLRLLRAYNAKRGEREKGGGESCIVNNAVLATTSTGVQGKASRPILLR